MGFLASLKEGQDLLLANSRGRGVSRDATSKSLLDQVLPLLFKESKFEQIEELKFGSHKEIIDHGIPLRKAGGAFERRGKFCIKSNI